MRILYIVYRVGQCLPETSFTDRLETAKFLNTLYKLRLCSDVFNNTR